MVSSRKRWVSTSDETRQGKQAPHFLERSARKALLDQMLATCLSARAAMSRGRVTVLQAGSNTSQPHSAYGKMDSSHGTERNRQGAWGNPGCRTAKLVRHISRHRQSRSTAACKSSCPAATTISRWATPRASWVAGRRWHVTAVGHGSWGARAHSVEGRQVKVRVTEEWQIFALSPHTCIGSDPLRSHFMRRSLADSAFALTAHSQTTATRHPFPNKEAVTSSSRCLLRRSFSTQNSVRVAGRRK